MSVTVKVGDVLSMAEAHFGESARGLWGTVAKKADKGYDRISIWFNNPEAVRNAQTVQIVSIDSVAIRNRKYTAQDGSQKWATDYTVNATVKDAGAERAVIQGAAQAFSDAVNDFAQMSGETDFPFA